MRLWHQSLINKLPRQQLLGQHREICALRGNGWGKKHSTVDYVFEYCPEYLIAYHGIVMNEMIRRGYNVDKKWFDAAYRGKSCQSHNTIDFELICVIVRNNPIYPEHNDAYLQECIENLKSKGVNIE